MVLSKKFKFCLTAATMTFLFSSPLHAQNINSKISNSESGKGSVNKAAIFSQNEAMITPEQFLDAVRREAVEEVKVSLSGGIDINVQNDVGESALHVVKNKALAEYLIAHGANVNLPDKQFGMTPLFYQEVAIARLLVAAGANVNAVSHGGNTPIIWFAYGNYLEGVKYLVSAGADIHAVNHDGKTALDVAEGFSDPQLIEYLRLVGAEKRYGK